MHHDYSKLTQDVSADTEQLRQQVFELEQCLQRIKAELSPPVGISTENRFQVGEQHVRRLLSARRLREQQLGTELFADPAWDILLEALASELGQHRTSVTDLCRAAAVPPTTALRWLGKLEEEGWLTREADPLDGRRQWVELTSSASLKLLTYFNAIHPSLLV